MSNIRGSVQLICPNPECINKSFVWRKTDNFQEHLCKKCKALLVPLKRDKKMQRWNQRAKQELRELNA